MEVVRLAPLLALLSTLGLSGSEASHHFTLTSLVKKSGGFQGCGQKLVAALNLVCDRMFNKRNFIAGYGIEEGSDGEEREEEERERKEDVEWREGGDGGIWRSRSHALGMFNRARRGVVNECCEKECSLRELRSYCLKPSAESE